MKVFIQMNDYYNNVNTFQTIHLQELIMHLVFILDLFLTFFLINLLLEYYIISMIDIYIID
jgi:type IV secretory pathway component VirB8